MDYWPDRTMDPALQRAFNRETRDEYAHIRDFLLLHYVPNQRIGEPFWDAMRNITLPDSLIEKIELFEHAGRIVSRRRELFSDISWWFVAHGMGLRARRHDPLVDIFAADEVRSVIRQVASTMGVFRSAAPMHDTILDRLLDPAETRRPYFGTVRATR